MIVAFGSLSGSILGAVAHEVGDLGEEGAEDGGLGLRDAGFLHGGAHQVEPAVALSEADGEREVTHAEAGVAALLDVGLGAAEAEDEEVGKAFFGAVPVVLRVEGADEVILPDAAVKRGDEGAERGFSEFGEEGGGGVGHESKNGKAEERRRVRRLHLRRISELVPCPGPPTLKSRNPRP